MVGDGLWFPFFFGEGGWVLVPVLLWRGWQICSQGSQGWVISHTDPALPSSVRHPVACGGVFGSATCIAWHAVVVPLRCGEQASLRGLIRLLFLEGVHLVWFLHVVSSSGGRWVHGPLASPSAGIRLPFR
jgi:hypothetical protein